MTQTNLLELAKQGNPQAIASLMNRSLQPRGMTATTELQGDCLQVILESAQIPNRQVLTTFVQNGMKNLGVRSIRSVRVVGKQTGSVEPAWMQEIELENYSRLSEQLGVISPAIQQNDLRESVAPPPPPRHRLTPLAADPLSSDQSPAETPLPPVTVISAETVHPASPAHTPAYTQWQPASEEAEVDISSLTSLDSLNRTGQFDPPSSDFSETTILPEDVAGTSTQSIPGSIGEDYLEEDVASIHSQPYLAGQYITSDQSITPQELAAARLSEANSEPLEFPIQPAYVNRQTRLQSVDEQSAIAPVEEDEADLEDEATAGASGNFWGALAAMLTGVLALAIIAYALWSYFKPSPEPDPVVGQDPAPVAPNPLAPNPPAASPNLPTAPATPTPPPAAPQGDVFQQGIQASEAALAQVQTAQTPAEWQQTANRLQGAIALLQQVPVDNPSYNVAQQKIAELQNQLNTAQQQASVAAVAPPAPAPACQPIPLSPTSPPIELSNLKFSGDGTSIEGCITNHTNQPIVNVSVSYLGSSNQDANLAQSGLNNISFTALEPGKTVPFRSAFTVDPSISKVRIEALFWTQAGSVQPQPQQTSVEVNR